MPVLSPQLIVSGAAAAVEFYRQAFGAVEVHRFACADGRLTHVELRLGDMMVWVCDDFPEWNHGEARNPVAFGGSPVTLTLQVPNADEVFARAVKLGATATMPLSERFWGARYGKLRDPFGHEWAVYTHIKEMTHDEIQRAQDAFFASIKK